MSHHRKPVFFDHSGKRWSRILRLAFGAALVFSIIGAVFSFSILVLPNSPIPLDNTPIAHGRISVPKLFSREEAARHVLATKSRNKLIKQIQSERRQNIKANTPGSAPYSTVVGFYVSWEPHSIQSLRDHISSMTYVIPEWLYLDLKSPSLFRDRRDNPLEPKRQNDEVLTLSRQHNVPIIPLIHNVVQGKGTWDWPQLRDLLKNPGAQQMLAINLRDFVKKNKFAGVNIDFEPGLNPATMSPKEYEQARQTLYREMPKFMGILNRVFHAENLLVTQDIPVPRKGAPGQPEVEEFDYHALSDLNDFAVVMLYDEHAARPDGNPGTIASQPWVEDMAEHIFQKMDSSKVVLGIGNYCYDWPVAHDSKGNLLEYQDVDGQPSGELAFQGQGTKVKLSQALGAAEEAGAPIEMDEDDLNPFFTYVDGNHTDHIIFMLDAVTAYNQIMALKGYEPKGVALWYLGAEDPGIWSFFSEGKVGKPINPKDVEKVNYSMQVVDDLDGQGEIVDLASPERPGIRQVAFDKDGLISSEKFSEYPTPFLVHHYGNRPGVLALTFDDGPNPKFTPEILKVLKKYKVPATFFVVGQQAERYPKIVKDCWDAGCEIGNHTYTHPHILDISKLRAELEINATQRIIESITGHSTKLFRAPYGDGQDKIAPGEASGQFLESIQKMGYVIVDMNIDPSDYLPKVTAQDIVDRIHSRIYNKVRDKVVSQNNVILMHDNGGKTRAATVEALDILIPELQKQGFKFVRVTDLLGPRHHDMFFPAVSHSQEKFLGLDRFMFESGYFVNTAFEIVFLISIFLGVLRLLIVGPLAVIQSRRSKRRKINRSFKPPVSVIIPAFNEEKVICRTIQSVLDSDYENLHVLVIDDGSLDKTAEVVKEQFSGNPRVTFVTKENGGKSSALNLGLSMSDAEIVICLDADTVFADDTISHLVSHFEDPKVGAVAGNVKVGNRMNPLTIWQSVEYITSQNFDRRAYAALNSVSVVPGAVGAWRKSAIIKAGGYDTDTLAEDTDLTFRIKLLGYHVRTENEAVAYTEAPDTIHALYKQRFRWAFGTLQSLWKHRKTMFDKKHGAFSMFVMPAMWIYSILFQAFSPIVDILVILSLFNREFMAVFTYYAAFFVIEFFGSLLAIKLDDEDPKQLAWLFWQRFFYRQFMYYVILKSIMAALRGGIVGWGKLQRKATVSVID